MDCDPHNTDLDLADFAQEFVRRSRAYREQYAQIAETARTQPGATVCKEMALSWGLVFPGAARRSGAD